MPVPERKLLQMAGATSSDITSSLSQSSEEDWSKDQRSNSEADLDSSAQSTCSSARYRTATSLVNMWIPPTTPGTINMLDVA